jgi:crossover junction endodeoxyribonuclease RuvC
VTVSRPAPAGPAAGSERLILGLDPGTASTGFGLVTGPLGGPGRLLEFGVIRTAAATPMPERLAEIHQAVGQLLSEHAPAAVAVEEVFFSSNVSTALVVGQARGVLLLAAAQAGVPVFEYKPNEVKQALTGHGRADKRQVQDMLRLVLGLEEIPRPDDAADAVAVALCHLQLARYRELGGGSRR